MNEIENIWVEIETNEGGVATTGYCGQINIFDYENIFEGTYKKPFVKITSTHWYTWPSDEDEKIGKEKKLIYYGKGGYSQYHGEMIIKVSTIVTIQRMLHGPDQADGIEIL